MRKKGTSGDAVLVQAMGGEAVLLDLASERYVGPDPIGPPIWALLDEHVSVQAVAGIITNEYDLPSHLNTAKVFKDVRPAVFVTVDTLAVQASTM